jgi:phosphate transport system substrate-binding protein
MKPVLKALSRSYTVACVITLAGGATAQNADLPKYEATKQVSGVIHICGSPQMGELLKLYERGFMKVQPAVHFNNDVTSTLMAVSGVSNGRADIGLLGREIWPTEMQAFESIKGHAPTVIDIATGSFDVPKATFALMIFVPRSNPIASLSTGQLERIFTASNGTADHGSSSNSPIRTWGDLGLKGDWANRPVHLYCFSVDNDKSQIFSQLIFSKGRHWNPGLNESSNAPGPNGADAGELIVQAVAKDPDAIGISNVHYATPEVKALPLSTPEQKVPVAPTRENVANRSYPLTRAVYMVVNNDALHPLNEAVIEFLRYALSRQGQQAVMQEGNYLPLPAEIALRQLRQLPASSK